MYSQVEIQERWDIINDSNTGIPDEGGHSIKCGRDYGLVVNDPSLKNPITYSDAQINAIVNRFFEGKNPPDKYNRGKAEILLGAPGSGKSLDGLNRYKALGEKEKASTIYVSYDETGAIFAIPEYIEDLQRFVPDYQGEHDPVDEETKDIRQRIWDNYRDPSQLIRSRILKRALAEGYNIMVDTTSSSHGSVKLIEKLRKLNYDQISCVGTFAPFDIGVLRCIAARVRPTSDLEVVSKRLGDPNKPAGALNMIEEMMQVVDYFEYQFNPDNENVPRFAFSAENGVVNKCDLGVLQQMYDCVPQDVFAIYEFMQAHPQSFKDFDPAFIEQSYDQFSSLIENFFDGAQSKPEYIPAHFELN